MYCPKCGTEVEQGGSFCPNCGTAVAQQGPAPVQTATAVQGAPAASVPFNAQAAAKTSGMAIISLVSGIVGLFFNPLFLLSLLAVVLGFIANGQIKKSAGTLKGKGLATGGIILGVLAIVLTVIMIAVGIGMFFW